MKKKEQNIAQEEMVKRKCLPVSSKFRMCNEEYNITDNI
jgi:hypothetical protein